MEQILPEKAGVVLEVGCGEGRVTRSLRELSDAVVGLDSSPSLIAYAVEADDVSDYVLGDATELPFRKDSFDTVVAYNSLMDLNDMPRGVAEAARVLKKGGRFCVCIVHPIRDAGRFTTDEDDAPFALSDYFESRRYEDRFQRDGLEMTFTSWRYPLRDYADALEAAGFLIERIKEPQPDPAKGPELKRAPRIPMFLFLRALKRDSA
jgi:SAM-dependent methyltransferase